MNYSCGYRRLAIRGITFRKYCFNIGKMHILFKREPLAIGWMRCAFVTGAFAGWESLRWEDYLML